MKFGVMFANTGFGSSPDGAVAVAQAAEAGGFETLWTVEHVVVPSGYESAYPYDPSGKMAGGAEAFDLPDPLIWLTWAAAHTERIRLGTGVLVLPQRNPVVTAKELATLDHLSGGRVTLGVGAGWLAEEFAALGVPFDERGARLDEYIDVLRELWAPSDDAEKSTVDGRFVTFERLHHAAPPGQRHDPDRHRRAHAGRRPAGRPARRRVLPRQRDDRGAGRAVRHRARRGRGGRARPDAIELSTAAMGRPGPEARRAHRAARRARRDPRRRPGRPAPTSSPSIGADLVARYG